MPTARAAAWTAWAVWRTRRSLKSAGLQAVVPDVPPLPPGARRGVFAVLRRLEPTCLERSLVEQAWLAVNGVRCDVVVGVARPEARVEAHAWLAGDALPSRAANGYSEIHRLPPSAVIAPKPAEIPESPRPYQLTALQTSIGMLVGQNPSAPPLPRALRAQTAREALEASILQALQSPPCVISFSGGRDSSAVLAVAAHVARREGLPLPIPVTLRFPDVGASDEGSWQELVVRHLALTEWEKVALTDEMDIVGPLAQRVMRQHGLLWPLNAHFHLPVAERAPGGSVLTGFGGDELLSMGWDWERVNQALTGRVRLNKRDAVRIAVAAMPPVVRRLFLERRKRHRPAPRLTWLRPDAEAAVARMKLDAAARAAVHWDENIRRDWWPSLYRSVCADSLDIVSRGAGSRFASSPLCDGVFLDALARERGRGGFASRTEAMQYLVGDLLPHPVLNRSTKGFFDGAFWNVHARQAAQDWDGSGVDASVVDPDVLHAMWKTEGSGSDARSWMLLQSAWLAQHRAAATRTSAATTETTGGAQKRG
nr:asparagine synthase-related protein [Blastococcus saxobsidens]